MESQGKRKQKIKIAFWGTDEFSVKVLDTLEARGIIPELVVTVADKPRGRKMLLTPPPAKIWAEARQIEVRQPSTISALPVFDHETWDLFIVASYGRIIPKAVLDIPTHGTINVHPSLLPKYRGATPIESAILAGDEETGVSIMLLDEYMDHGPIISQSKITLNGTETYPELRDKAAELGANLIADNLENFVAGKITLQEQDHQAATYTSKIEKHDGLVDLAQYDPATINRKFRAYITWPSTYFFVHHGDHQLRIIIKTCHLVDDQLVIDRVLPEGKKEMDWASFEKGYLN